MADVGCTCVGVEFGTHANQETVTTPSGKVVGIDRCILSDVRNLWDIGLSTIVSCCGQGKAPGYIAVPMSSPHTYELRVRPRPITGFGSRPTRK